MALNSDIKVDDQEKALGKNTFKYSSGGSRLRMSLMLLFADFLSIGLAGFLAVGLRIVFGEALRLELFLQTLPVLISCVIIYAFLGLYPAVGLSSVDELRLLAMSTSIVVITLAALSFWVRNAQEYSRLTLTLTWIFSLALLPFGRAMIRTLGIWMDVWGEPVAVFGYGKQGHWALDFFKKNKRLGFRPVVILDFSTRRDKDATNSVWPGWYASMAWKSAIIQVINTDAESLVRDLQSLIGLRTALLISSDVPVKLFDKITRSGFQRLILIPNLEQVSSYGVRPFDFGGILGLEIRHNLLDMSQQAIKRIMDIGIVTVGGILILPVLLLIAFLVKITSRGGIFYGHLRIGRGGQNIKAWKFRTMDPSVNLEEYLNKNPEMRHEWETTFKLKNDPRVTRLGKFLRRFSIDEFPQLWNVLKGEMSLVGPRPIVENEISQYGEIFNPYTWVKPGITGLWQVSGRNDTTYEERTRLDEYYIRNWSIWLDLHILARTILVVIKRDGAY